MDITVVGRNAEISSRLRDYVEEKATKVEQFDHSYSFYSIPLNSL